MDGRKQILYIDDDDDDRFLVKEAIESYGGNLELNEATSGVDGIGYLEEAITQNNLPCLVILDLNMPGMDGKETLLALRKDEHLKDIPVVIFTTSSSQLDKTFCDKNGVQMITKPLDFTKLSETIKTMLGYCKGEELF